jgi:hypothetical protein
VCDVTVPFIPEDDALKTPVAMSFNLHERHPKREKVPNLFDVVKLPEIWIRAHNGCSKCKEAEFPF